jgi:hypothetical protein
VLFRNNSDAGGTHFERISNQVGLEDSTVSRGVAVFDYDNDGDSDLLVSNFFDPPSLYENSLAQGNWLNVKLEGTESNRDAFGTIVEVRANGKSYKKYHHGAQFFAQNIQPLHFGLSNALSIEKIMIIWPSGYVEEVGAVNVNQTIHIKEKSGIVSAVRQAPANQAAAPEVLRLIDNYPNPFNGSTQIRFEINAPGTVELTINNLHGQTVKIIKKSFTDIGEKLVTWDATDATSRPVSSGLYFYSLKFDGGSARGAVGKMIYLR